jgi:hypothetical protein
MFQFVSHEDGYLADFDVVRLRLWTAATDGHIVHPRMTRVLRATVDWYWRGKRKNSEKNLSQCHAVHNKSHMDWPGREPGPPRWEAGDWSSKPRQDHADGTQNTEAIYQQW